MDLVHMEVKEDGLRKRIKMVLLNEEKLKEVNNDSIINN